MKFIDNVIKFSTSEKFKLNSECCQLSSAKGRMMSYFILWFVTGFKRFLGLTFLAINSTFAKLKQVLSAHSAVWFNQLKWNFNFWFTSMYHIITERQTTNPSIHFQSKNAWNSQPKEALVKLVKLVKLLVLLIMLVLLRQAYSSDHQIVIWICFWFCICQYLSSSTKMKKYWDGLKI